MTENTTAEKQIFSLMRAVMGGGGILLVKQKETWYELFQELEDQHYKYSQKSIQKAGSLSVGKLPNSEDKISIGAHGWFSQ